VAFAKSERAATARHAVNDPRKYAHTGKRRGFSAYSIRRFAQASPLAHWPGQAALFQRKGDVDRAEACLIGLAGLLRERGR
jgi:hypothetical protein